MTCTWSQSCELLMQSMYIIASCPVYPHHTWAPQHGNRRTPSKTYIIISESADPLQSWDERLVSTVLVSTVFICCMWRRVCSQRLQKKNCYLCLWFILLYFVKLNSFSLVCFFKCYFCWYFKSFRFHRFDSFMIFFSFVFL